MEMNLEDINNKNIRLMKDYFEVRGLCARALRRETRLTVYPARSGKFPGRGARTYRYFLSLEIEFKEAISHDPELSSSQKLDCSVKINMEWSIRLVIIKKMKIC